MFSFLAKLILRKYRPTIIAVTGSVGKTIAERAIETVLSRTMTVRVSHTRNNDSVTSILHAILGGGFFAGLASFVWRDTRYPRVLLLEYGADYEGAIARCCAIAKPDIGIVTSLAPVALTTFATLERIVREKTLVVQQGKRDGWTVLASDDERVRGLKSRAKGRVMTYGLSASADVRAVEIAINQEVRDGHVIVQGMNYKLVYKGSAVPVHLSGVLGSQHILGTLAAAAVGILSDINLVSLSEALTAYDPVAGRMRLLSGIKHTLLIDDTYTASPTSVLAGLDGLDALAVKPGAEKFAVLGDMMPLGDMSAEGYRLVGEKAGAIAVDYLITVGKLSRDAGHAARAKGMLEERIYHFTTPEEAGRFIQDRLEEGDYVYVSGNTDLRMEKIVKELMAEPLKADALLVRR